MTISNDYPSGLGFQFLEAAKAPPKPKLWMYCPRCGVRNDFVMVEETEREEVYRCPDDGTELRFTVR